MGVIVNGGSEHRYTISGIADFGNSSSIVGATLAIFDLPTAQRLFGKVGELDQIDVAAKPGVASAALLSQIRSVLPPDARVRTGRQQAQSEVNDANALLTTFRYFLLAFGGIALFVGSFVIANTLSITVAQRAREFATLRTLGATSRQVRFTVMLEGIVTGLLASAVGLLVGLGLAKGLEALFTATGATLPSAGLVFATRTVIVSLVVGTGVTLVASLWPAVRATRVPRSRPCARGRCSRPRGLRASDRRCALTVCAAGVALVCVGGFVSGLSTGPRLIVLAVGVLALFLGVAMVAPSIARPLARVLGWPATRVGGSAGTLARSNAMRNPARTASTAAALMIGLALVTTFAVLGAGAQAVDHRSGQGRVPGRLRAHVRERVYADRHRVDQRVCDGPGSRPSSPASARARAACSARRSTSPESTRDSPSSWCSSGRTARTARWRPSAPAARSSTRALRAHTISPSVRRITLETPTGGRIRLRVTGIYSPPQADNPLGNVSISARTFDTLYPNPENIFTLIATPGGVTAANTAALNRVLAAFPDAQLQTEQQFISSQEAAINSELNLLYILLALSIIVSLFGIVNTLVLTVFERTRELGMLRAIGMTRRQTRRMIRHEAVITALLGAALGIPVGIGLAGLFDRALGNIPFAVPWGTIVDLRARRDLRRPGRCHLPRPPRRPAQHPERTPVRVARQTGSDPFWRTGYW